MHDDESDAPSEGAVQMVTRLQDVSVPDTELAGVEQAARRLNDTTRKLADASSVLCDPFAFGAALRQRSESS